ncbi:hypothetical protein [Phaeodactylibacter luteus]|uniref:Uncharacterized protein n=1 Tax=Phaeodactylibacter luteus TaxID=1564516 RepID=A0A5C6RIU9_9BACT|nr:hypothetical protein [Phaeodactylibacter luteus]TXB62358.1 hypothetical protein FRY97_14455 [Phaeodactylibacter luteus]
MQQENKTNFSPWKIGLIVVGIILLLRFAGPLRFMLLTLVLLGGVGFLIFLVYEVLRQQRLKKSRGGDVPAEVAERMQEVDQHIRQYSEQLKAIKGNIRELRRELRDEGALNIKNRTDAQYLIREFEAEYELGQAKVSFYRTARHKLERLLHNHQLSRTLAQKEAELRKLKEQRYEELADMEALRSDMELEALYLDTIDQLALKVPDNLSLDHVRELQTQLEEMTKGLEG